MAKKKKLKVGSLYAGVGGICKGFELAGCELVWGNEYDDAACKTYKSNFSHTLYETDVYTLDEKKLPKIDILTAGFPCQPFSVAGYQKGFTDPRGNHFFRILDILNTLKPQCVFLENVRNLVSHDNGKTFNLIQQELIKLGYHIKFEILNSSEYGNVPQNRERIYIVGFKKIKYTQKFNFPKLIPLTKTIKDCLEPGVIPIKYYYTTKTPIGTQIINEATNKNTVYQWRRIYLRENKNNLCPTLTANMGTGGHNVPIIKDSFGVRKLTPQECFNFQGFTNIQLPAISNASLYKQAGNSVSVPVIKRIAEEIINAIS